MNEKQIILIAKKHKTWVDIVMSFGCTKQTAEDIVQEMYIKMHNYLIKTNNNIMYEKEINYYFIFKTLNSIFIDLKRKNKNITFIPLDNIQLNYNEVDYEGANQKVLEELSKMYWYDRKVFEIINGGESIADFSRKSYIQYYSLYNTYKKVKEKLKKLL
tara:strand:+ start:681 stop:1157 length:477 start_codon:yes stop_codon:yes gene_type:complete